MGSLVETTAATRVDAAKDAASSFCEGGFAMSSEGVPDPRSQVTFCETRESMKAQPCRLTIEVNR